MPGLRPCGITLRNVDFVFPGASAQALGKLEPDSECEAKFPWPYVYGRALPAYGLYARHADNVVLDGAVFRLAEGASDPRPSTVRVR